MTLPVSNLFVGMPKRPAGTAQYLIAALFFCLPFNGITALNRSLLVLFIVMGGLRLLQGQWRGNKPWPVLVWFAMPVLSLLWSVNGAQTRSQLLPDVFYPAIGFLIGYGLLTLQERRLAMLAFLTGLATLCLWSVVIALQYGVGETQALYDATHGVGKFSTLIVLAVSLLMGWLLYRPQYWQSACLLLLLSGAYVSQNRMVWLSLALVVVIAFPVWWHFSGTRLSAQYKILLGGGPLLLLAGIYVSIAATKLANALEPEVKHSVLDAFIHNERFEMWRFWLERWHAAPWLGIGFGYDIQRLTYGALKPESWFPLMMAHAHNVLLDYAVQLGVVGLAIFVFMLLWLAKHFLRQLQRGHTRDANWITGLVGLCLLAAMLSKSLTDDFFTRVPLLAFWLLIGIVLGAGNRQDKPED